MVICGLNIMSDVERRNYNGNASDSQDHPKKLESNTKDNCEGLEDNISSCTAGSGMESKPNCKDLAHFFNLSDSSINI